MLTTDAKDGVALRTTSSLSRISFETLEMLVRTECRYPRYQSSSKHVILGHSFVVVNSSAVFQLPSATITRMLVKREGQRISTKALMQSSGSLVAIRAILRNNSENAQFGKEGEPKIFS